MGEFTAISNTLETVRKMMPDIENAIINYLSKNFPMVSFGTLTIFGNEGSVEIMLQCLLPDGHPKGELFDLNMLLTEYALNMVGVDILKEVMDMVEDAMQTSETKTWLLWTPDDRVAD